MKGKTKLVGRLVTLDVSHSVGMRAVAGEERVMAQCTEASAARGQPGGQFRGELQRVTFAATPLTRRYLGSRWCVWERHLKQQQQTPISASLTTTKPYLRSKHSHILTERKTAIKEYNFTSSHVIFEYNNNKSRSRTLYLRKQPSATNSTDVCCPCCQETWTKQETMATNACLSLHQDRFRTMEKSI